jgi:hypothetical protein
MAKRRYFDHAALISSAMMRSRILSMEDVNILATINDTVNEITKVTNISKIDMAVSFYFMWAKPHEIYKQTRT